MKQRRPRTGKEWRLVMRNLSHQKKDIDASQREEEKGAKNYRNLYGSENPVSFKNEFQTLCINDGTAYQCLELDPFPSSSGGCTSGSHYFKNHAGDQHHASYTQLSLSTLKP